MAIGGILFKLVQKGYAVLFFREEKQDYVSISKGEEVEVAVLTENLNVENTLIETLERLEGKPMPEFRP